MLRSYSSVRVVLLSLCFIALGSLTGALVPVQTVHARDGHERCYDKHRCEGGSEGQCEETELNRFCEYSPSGLCMHWYGSCPYN